MSGSGRTIAIFGAGGATGTAAVRLAGECGLSVRAIEHDWPADAPDSERITHHKADVMTDDLADLVDGADAVISAIGLGLSPQTIIDPPPLYTRGTGNIADAMERTGVRRLAVISATFVETRNIGPLWFRLSAIPALSRTYAQMAEMEDMLRARRAIDWTAARPGWLLDLPYTGDYRVTDSRIAPGLIRTRHADLADFLLRCVTQEKHVHETPAIARKEERRYESPEALAAEFG